MQLNIMTSPLFFCSDTQGNLKRYSYAEVVLGQVPQDSQLVAGNPFQELAQISLMTGMCSTMVEDTTGDLKDWDTEQFEAWINKWEPSFEVYGEVPRFMQYPFEPGEGVVKGDVYGFLAVDLPGGSTTNPFHRKVPLKGYSYCPHCAALDLFGFQMMTPGSGKASGGPHLHGVNTYIPKRDPLEMLRANTVLRPSMCRSASHFPSCMVVLDEMVCPDSFPWLDKGLMEALVKGTKLPPNSPYVNTRYFRFWMPRQVWLTVEKLETPMSCLCCGMDTEYHVSSVVEGKGSGDTAKTKGALALPPGSYLSPLKPHTQKKDPKTKEMGDRPYTLDSIQRLLSVASDFLDGDSAAPVVRQAKDVLSVRVLSITTKNSSFGKALLTDIPLSGSIEETAGILQEMAEQAQLQRNALFGALSHYFQPKKHHPTPMKVALKGLDAFVGDFMEYMADPPREKASPDNPHPKTRWEKDLYRKARSLYDEACVVSSPDMGNRVVKSTKESKPRSKLYAEGYRFLTPKKKSK